MLLLGLSYKHHAPPEHGKIQTIRGVAGDT